MATRANASTEIFCFVKCLVKRAPPESQRPRVSVRFYRQRSQKLIFASTRDVSALALCTFRFLAGDLDRHLGHADASLHGASSFRSTNRLKGNKAGVIIEIAVSIKKEAGTLCSVAERLALTDRFGSFLPCFSGEASSFRRRKFVEALAGAFVGGSARGNETAIKQSRRFLMDRTRRELRSSYTLLDFPDSNFAKWNCYCSAYGKRDPGDFPDPGVSCGSSNNLPGFVEALSSGPTLRGEAESPKQGQQGRWHEAR
ncbi:hypothetical protein V1477_007559 [Vespula maculifrons]|uniref:Uncharacterized protein n=1 Tax=Vespula maculifrons TaxID=7453 RepID=A0ABD2CIT8_VESMC